MATIEGTLQDFRDLDLLARGDTVIHRLDARAKVLVTGVFICTVISFGKYELTALFPFFIFPAVMIARGNLPFRALTRKIVVVIPFVLAVGILNPFFDQEILSRVGGLGVSGGWLSFASLAVRATLTVGAALILVGVTGFSEICRALERLGMPQVFVVQLLFLYRYIFVLSEEGTRAARARELRSCGKKGRGMGAFASLVGHLLLRTWQRAERIHRAMVARGFTGEFHGRQKSCFGRKELLFLFGWSLCFIVLRLHNASQLLGGFVTGLFP